MKKKLLTLGIALVCGCTDYVADWDSKYEGEFTQEAHNIPVNQVCLDGSTTLLNDGSCATSFLCVNDAWVPQNTVCNGVEQKKICENGETTAVSDGSCTSNFICSGNTWVLVGQPVCTTPVVQSSSSKKATVKSSSSKITYLDEITYAEVSGTVKCSNAMFCGKSGDAQVHTGKSDGTGTAGYWFWYDDSDNGGSSFFTWTYGGSSLTFVDNSMAGVGGIAGTATVRGEDGYLGLAFNGGGERQQGFDISAWKGLCIIYQANAYTYLELHPANEKTVTKYDNPTATLPRPNKANVPYVVNIPWGEFVQGGWGRTLSGYSASKTAAVISFTFKNSASFIVYAVGKYGTCN